MFGREPALIVGAIGALIALGVGFGLPVTPAQFSLIMAAVVAVLALITRSQVSPAQDVQLALKMPQGSSQKLLDQVIKTDVQVGPNDTKADVASKVARAELNHERTI